MRIMLTRAEVDRRQVDNSVTESIRLCCLVKDRYIDRHNTYEDNAYPGFNSKFNFSGESGAKRRVPSPDPHPYVNR